MDPGVEGSVSESLRDAVWLAGLTLSSPLAGIVSGVVFQLLTGGVSFCLEGGTVFGEEVGYRQAERGSSSISTQRCQPSLQPAVATPMTTITRAEQA